MGAAGTQRGRVPEGCLGAKASHKSAEDCAGLESPRRNGKGIVSRGNTIGPSGISRMDLIPLDHCGVSAWRVMSRGCRARRTASSPTLQPWGGRAPAQAWGMVREESFSQHPVNLEWLRVPRGAQLEGPGVPGPSRVTAACLQMLSEPAASQRGKGDPMGSAAAICTPPSPPPAISGGQTSGLEGPCACHRASRG